MELGPNLRFVKGIFVGEHEGTFESVHGTTRTLWNHRGILQKITSFHPHTPESKSTISKGGRGVPAPSNPADLILWFDLFPDLPPPFSNLAYLVCFPCMSRFTLKIFMGIPLNTQSESPHFFGAGRPLLSSTSSLPLLLWFSIVLFKKPSFWFLVQRFKKNTARFFYSKRFVYIFDKICLPNQLSVQFSVEPSDQILITMIVTMK